MTHPSHQHHHSAPGAEDSDLAELLDLDAEVLHAHQSDVTAWLKDRVGKTPVRRILDLGSGTGSGTFALLRRFPDAEAIAVDQSPQFLRHLRDKAHDLGLTDRVRTVEADLDAAWPHFGGADLIWIAKALHHMADPDHALREMFAALRPGGLLTVVEIDGFPRFLPDDLGLGRPGLEARCHAALAETQSAELPHLGSDWGPPLSRAGFSVEAQRLFTVDLTAPLPESTGRYAQTLLSRMRDRFGGRLAVDDLATLDVLLDSESPDSLLRRDDLTVRTERTAWVARRPPSAE